jgi:two-component system, chemotaxis family, chemotaxis protein CheY
MTNVLVVDDSLMVRQQVSRILTGAGFTVTAATDGVDALEKLAKLPDLRLIVSDVNMPKMSGLELLEELRNRKSVAVPVIMLTTEGQADMIQKAKALGASAWIVKPLKQELLLSTAKKLTGSA